MDVRRTHQLCRISISQRYSVQPLTPCVQCMRSACIAPCPCLRITPQASNLRGGHPPNLPLPSFPFASLRFSPSQSTHPNKSHRDLTSGVGPCEYSAAAAASWCLSPAAAADSAAPHATDRPQGHMRTQQHAPTHPRTTRKYTLYSTVRMAVLGNL
jgi:hypothetical protein